VRIDESEDYIMQHAIFATARRSLKPLAALLLATALGGCVGYSGNTFGDNGYNYPSSYYAGHSRAYNTSYNYRPYYSPGYDRYSHNYEGRGGGN